LAELRKDAKGQVFAYSYAELNRHRHQKEPVMWTDLIILMTTVVISAVLGLPDYAMAREGSVDDIVNVAASKHYKAVYNIHEDAIDAGINRGLYYARGLLESYKQQGVKLDQLDIHLVVHGAAAYSLMNDKTYRVHTSDPFTVNPNAQVVEELLSAGVKVELCHITMTAHGWKVKNTLPGVTVVHDAYTRLIDLQNEGYANIGGF
jgi:intracellular sulfur oxidation DsrE/DsrF family protein